MTEELHKQLDKEGTARETGGGDVTVRSSGPPPPPSPHRSNGSLFTLLTDHSLDNLKTTTAIGVSQAI